MFDPTQLPPSLIIQGTFAICLAIYFLGCGIGTLHRLIEERRSEKMVRDIIADIDRCDAAVAALIKFREAQSGHNQEGEYHAC
ncbi:hypothetical protein [Sinorhizobium chiapasense]|uniref:Uncharacterized protein n=1 Tax=Sinorhizobium chiapasense TaxID=501572 RepID=A0ABZ2BGQ1_9HYPH